MRWRNSGGMRCCYSPSRWMECLCLPSCTCNCRYCYCQERIQRWGSGESLPTHLTQIWRRKPIGGRGNTMPISEANSEDRASSLIGGPHGGGERTGKTTHESVWETIRTGLSIGPVARAVSASVRSSLTGSGSESPGVPVGASVGPHRRSNVVAWLARLAGARNGAQPLRVNPDGRSTALRHLLACRDCPITKATTL